MRLRTIAVLMIVALLGAGLFVYLGIYDASASSGHSTPLYHLLHYAMRRSVQARIQKIEVPDLSTKPRRTNGFAIFQQHCVECHGAPGIAPGAIAIGMIPAPSNLVAAGREWHPAELYWVVKHGVKMTAMPAWEYKLSEQQLWDAVALMKWLPSLSPDDYRHLQSPPTDLAPPRASERLRPGDIAAGRRAVTQYLCATCHRVPGIPGIGNEVGPPLTGMAKRRYIGGVLLNTHENMQRWLRDPQAIDPHSAMPNLNMTEQDARDITAFLSSLK